jgi:eukaryotic-like serine/threonine-protein kinase
MPGLAPLPPHVGSVLADRYELIRHIARGGMGDVYEATDGQLRRQVAVKVFRAAGPADRSRFDAEVRVLASLNHPGLARVFDAGSHGDDAFVVLELIEGPCLADALAARGPVPAVEAARLGADLADSLDYIHRHGVVHRDVTTRNVLCGPGGRPRLVDFGIVRLLDTPRVTATAMAVGTAAFMAPEQVQGLDVTPAADVYALGLVLLEALTGRRAFTGTAHEVAVARLARDPDTAEGVPGAWQELLRAMTARRPEDRPSAAAVRDRLVQLAEGVEEATGPLPLPGVAPIVATGVASAGADAPTAAMAVDGGTAILPAPPLPFDDEPVADRERRRSNRTLWALLVGLAVAALVGVAAAADRSPSAEPDGATTIPAQSEDEDGGETTPTEVPITTVPPTVAATTAIPEVIAEEPGPDQPPPVLEAELPPGQEKKVEEGLEELDD